MDAAALIALSAISAVATLVVVSMGLAVVFGLMRVVNMAHGEFMMIGAFTTTTLVLGPGVPLALAIPAAAVSGAAVGAILEVTLIRHIYRRRPVDTLLATFGVGLVLFQLAVDIFGTSAAGIPTPLGAFRIGSYSASAYELLLMPVAAACILGGVHLLFTRTRYGLLARATAQNPATAAALGVDAARVNFMTFTLGSALAGLAGGLLAPMVAVTPGMGQAYVGRAFMTVVVGGPAFIAGLLASAGLLGGASSLLSQAATSLWGITGMFALAIVLLRLQPAGLSGRWRRQL